MLAGPRTSNPSSSRRRTAGGLTAGELVAPQWAVGGVVYRVCCTKEGLRVVPPVIANDEVILGWPKRILGKEGLASELVELPHSSEDGFTGDLLETRHGREAIRFSVAPATTSSSPEIPGSYHTVHIVSDPTPKPTWDGGAGRLRRRTASLGAGRPLRRPEVSLDALSGLPVAPPNVALVRLADQLVDPTFDESRGDRHVVAAKCVAQRPRVHEPVTHRMPISDLVLGTTQFKHVILLDVDGDIRDWAARSQILVGQPLVAVLSRHSSE